MDRPADSQRKNGWELLGFFTKYIYTPRCLGLEAIPLLHSRHLYPDDFTVKVEQMCSMEAVPSIAHLEKVGDKRRMSKQLLIKT